ncbi:MAG: hypothetical protein A2Y62_08380 [Candidatus Fischerbacteria bacterium RBG_13_37_8]|uniref:Uncharacterized protein n=1 Tax=Candidatus Fischerbacteria bacterium RBG_13_37_8 TaxID=1817863 RepID=A0A1F5VRQ5_9BACT|nr:MAG: hypothetical protein A2Y62_08380 [Candidatus Fischerbacteria bacterium RBG_13_37_8]
MTDKRILFRGLIFILLSLMISCYLGNHLTKEKLEKLPADELVREYGKEIMRHGPCIEYERILEEIIMKKPEEVLLGVAKVFNEYDPNSFKGRMNNKRAWSHWAFALIWGIDNNKFRIRAIPEGRIALEALGKELERRKAAGEHEHKDRKGVYKSDVGMYNDMLGANSADDDIALHLQKDYQIQLSKEELNKFSDFLIAKDPAYYQWGNLDFTIPKEKRKPLEMRPYYEAYLEFKKAEQENNQESEKPVE